MNLVIALTSLLVAWSPAGNEIKTKWAAEVSPENARTEYPRPQMVRQDWKCLNGLWDYAISSKEAETMPAAEGRILVPFCVESALSGVGRTVDWRQLLWYRTTIARPEGWDGRKILLHFDAVDWAAEVFVDGKSAICHTGGYVGFEIDVTEALADGSAEIVVKVWDPSDNPGFSVPRGKQRRDAGGIWYTPVTGIWQSVWMEAVDCNAHIRDYNIAAALDGTINVTADVAGKADVVNVELLQPQIGYNPENPGKTRTLVKAETAQGAPASLKLKKPKLWTPDSPWLYGLRISLYKDGKLIDKVDGYTAIRTISEKKDARGVKRLALNDEILFQYGPLDQGWWPDGLYTAPTAEAMAWDIVKTKEFGFNMIRKHIKVEPSRWYYDCDRLGMMVWQDMPCIGDNAGGSSYWAQGVDLYDAGRDYYALTDASASNYYKEWGEIISALKKFQSIVVWIPFNEAWGQFDTEAVCEFTKSLDGTRLINAASGGNWIKGAGDILDSHFYPVPKMRILDPDMINVLGEYGGIGRPIPGHLWNIGNRWGYVQFSSEEKVTDTYCLYAKDLIDLKQLDMCSAAVYTQTTDVEGEVNGLFTYDREVIKLNMKRVREANLAVINAPVEPALPLVQPYAFHSKAPDTGNHLHLFTLRNGALTMQVTDFGARVISLFTPDRNGRQDDVVVGYGDADRFIHNTGERFLGATVGRVANRIGGGTFTLDGKTYTLPQNNNGQTLHGGLLGVDMVTWKVAARNDSSIIFEYTVPDGQDGFPGNLKIKLRYTLTSDNSLDIKYEATTDKATPVNLSNHAFFNLRGSVGGSILDHVLTIDADAITPVDGVLIPTGEILPVEGTPFDFREPHAIGERINAGHRQLEFGKGYDHNWVLNGAADGSLRKVCTVYEPTTGRTIEISTDQPGLQFYSGNFFDGSYCGKTSGVPVGFRGAIALETQKWPDGINHPNFPDTVLRPGQVYTQHSVYKFGVRKQ